MRTKGEPLGLFCADIHLSDSPPVSRAGEPDWYLAQSRVLQQIDGIAKEHDVFVFVAGDVFDRPRVSPRLEILALSHMGERWRFIPGQHDLPNHRMDRMIESSYGVLTYGNGSNVVGGWESKGPGVDNKSFLHSFPFGETLEPCPKSFSKYNVNVALIHHMVWEGKPPYPGAPASGTAKEVRKALSGFDVVFAGDNHEAFISEGSPLIVNCGSVMRRTATQEGHRPAVYLLHTDKTVETIYLDTTADFFSREHIEQEKARDDRIASFVRNLKEDVEVELSFKENLRRYCEANGVAPEVHNMILEEMK